MMLIVPLLALAQVPIPPPHESYAAAIELWQQNAPSAEERRSAVDRAVDEATAKALVAIGIAITPGSLTSVKRWLPKFDALKPVMARHVPADLTAADAVVAECVMKDLAYSLSPEEIRSVQAFTATAIGRKFWSASRMYRPMYLTCYQSALDIRATDADYRAVGLAPPKPERVKRTREITVN